MKTYIWAVDAGHAWLAVKAGELISLGIADKITEYSYVKGGTVYLEEDCDAAEFIRAYTERHGVAPNTKQGKYWDRQPCRSFARYSTKWIQSRYPHHTITQAEVNDAINVRHLADYMDQRSRWLALFNKESITFPLTQESVDTLVSQLNGDLSPENLHCDGEISASQARAKYEFYSLVARELEAYCKNNGLSMREVYEL